ncbi:L-type lectin-domain containing receptor kinase VIII.2 [Acorus gramineus]|uniref:non-specific serine/threonine protein kinase n=1 Tax=Acorus gramineus TaxID=55184 RepID=A0AAV9B4W8_ACOGR|nr:L-type lectin-domain containing receptor kinase VIII.2 [Acorus gramineus]KAK1271366.1 L-type lectin-domain containing receptor kinase VIII.2 [Acorus gramineus]
MHQHRHHIVLSIIIITISIARGGVEEEEEGLTKFDFGTLTLGSLKLLGDAHLKNGSIRLSRDLPVPNSGSGRAMYSKPIRLRHATTHAPFSFSTFFSFSVTNLNPSSIGGGLAFLLSPDDQSLGDPGGYLGILNATTAGIDDVVAVEFDTLMDVEFEDVNGNHVGVDLGSLVSAQFADLDLAGIDLKSGDSINAWIDYDGKGLMFDVFVSYSNLRPADPVISFPFDLGHYVGDFAFVGFSGSTQGSTEIHSIEWWSFAASSSSPSPPPSQLLPPMSQPPPPLSPTTNASSPAPPPLAPSVSISAAAQSSFNASKVPSSSCKNNKLCRRGPAAVAGVAMAGAFFLVAFASLAAWAVLTKRKSRPRVLGRPSSDLLALEIVMAPREFSYKELNTATRGFDPSRIIGHGAFGTVYKGIIPESGALFAVKRCISGTEGGRDEFLSELSIIASLRHRNLLRLQGWCHEKGEILLVYDYMPNGSLDKALMFDDGEYGGDGRYHLPLPWRQRKEVLKGVASALAYLHGECESCVIHRDVKSSNVMLDEGFNARLGDFGLARQVAHGDGQSQSPGAATAAAGTMGYLAPEYLLTGRATEKTDVFSFGALVLEVACGRRPIQKQNGEEEVGCHRRSNLVEWVWGLHTEGRILEAADRRLVEYDEGEMRKALLVGLVCSHPDPVARPSMRGVVQMLSGEAEAPPVPRNRPSIGSLSSNHHLLMSLQDSVSDYNAVTLTISSTSSSCDSYSLTSFSEFRVGDGVRSSLLQQP